MTLTICTVSIVAAASLGIERNWTLADFYYQSNKTQTIPCYLHR